MRPTLPLLALLLLCSGLVLVTQAKPAVAPVPVTPPAPILADAKETTPERRVIAYYFHTDYRCPSCRKIEAFSHEAIEAGFAKELESGRLVWRLVNIEEKGNEHFVADYQLFTKSLVIVEEVKGEQARWKNLPKVWELLSDKAEFLRYVQGEVRGYLSETL